MEIKRGNLFKPSPDSYPVSDSANTLLDILVKEAEASGRTAELTTYDSLRKLNIERGIVLAETAIVTHHTLQQPRNEIDTREDILNLPQP